MEARQTAELLTRLRESLATAKPSDPAQDVKDRVEAYNQSEGSLNLTDGYNCPKCKNRGMFAFYEEGPTGYPYERYRYCECRKARMSIARMERSGITRQDIERQTFAKYETPEDWQARAKAIAERYSKNSEDEYGARWLLICGQVGSGKTHLCTAVCRELLLQGLEVYYIRWRDEMARLKQCMSDAEEYADRMNRLTTCDVLYLDDLFKPVKGEGITASDIKLTYDIINGRYRKSRTIISGELMLNEMLELDEATASRIAEMSKGFQVQIAREDGRNWRLR